MDEIPLNDVSGNASHKLRVEGVSCVENPRHTDHIFAVGLDGDIGSLIRLIVVFFVTFPVQASLNLLQ